ncbi:microcystin-dependent protein [Mucilaginibacter yixingensis]|uniref:Microcystin-dependent protein n=1 Tax=Mucilaginibacter yixingensis TaxID=1295612 RepID=A0A2T5JG79_9SPHI|nr:tail fiber protein [Mucilaginibacter yixingensis]PTR01415.1 microcystin-dependent protein [Mucilaginibacter yixingensis]
MEPSYIGAVWMFGGNFAPVNFHFCDGSLQSIAENEALYALLGTTYGGDGVSTYALPDLRGRCVIGQGTGPGLPAYTIGQMAGTESVTITTSMMASHTHLLNVGTNASASAPSSTLYLNQMTAGGAPQTVYTNATPAATLNTGTVASSGGSIPIDIIQPTLCISYLISLYGIFPSQN